jgi:hypothetical protein
MSDESWGDYPDLVCWECGYDASDKVRRSHLHRYHTATYHIGTCDICGRKKAVTEVRDFFFPKFNQRPNGLHRKNRKQR